MVPKTAFCDKAEDFLMNMNAVQLRVGRRHKILIRNVRRGNRYVLV